MTRNPTLDTTMATYHDADLILRFYDLRREAVMRKAREWFVGWFPATAEEARTIGSVTGSQENAYVRQVTSYWEMAFSIANSHAVESELFAKNCGEGLLFAVKCRWLAGKFPEAWTRLMPEAEAFTAGNATAQKKVETFKSRLAGK